MHAESHIYYSPSHFSDTPVMRVKSKCAPLCCNLVTKNTSWGLWLLSTPFTFSIFMTTGCLQKKFCVSPNLINLFEEQAVHGAGNPFPVIFTQGRMVFTVHAHLPRCERSFKKVKVLPKKAKDIFFL